MGVVTRFFRCPGLMLLERMKRYPAFQQLACNFGQLWTPALSKDRTPDFTGFTLTEPPQLSAIINNVCDTIIGPTYSSFTCTRNTALHGR